MKSYHITVDADIISDIEKSSVMTNKNKQSSEAAFSIYEMVDVFNDSQEAGDMAYDFIKTADIFNQSQEKAEISQDTNQNAVIAIKFSPS